MKIFFERFRDWLPVVQFLMTSVMAVMFFIFSYEARLNKKQEILTTLEIESAEAINQARINREKIETTEKILSFYRAMIPRIRFHGSYPEDSLVCVLDVPANVKPFCWGSISVENVGDYVARVELDYFSLVFSEEDLAKAKELRNQHGMNDQPSIIHPNDFSDVDVKASAVELAPSESHRYFFSFKMNKPMLPPKIYYSVKASVDSQIMDVIKSQMVGIDFVMPKDAYSNIDGVIINAEFSDEHKNKVLQLIKD